MVATDAGDGALIELIEAVPLVESADGTTLLNVTPVLLVTRMVNVTVSPLNLHVGICGTALKSAIKQDAVVTVITGDVIVREVRAPPLSLANAVNEIVPVLAFVLYVHTSEPLAPALRVRLTGLEVVLALAPPLSALSVGGLGTEVAPVRPDVDRLVICIVSVNAPTQLRGTASDDGVIVINNDFNVHEGCLLTVTFVLPPLPVVYEARTSRRRSVVSALTE
jgi:hypothetical protein